MSLSLTLSNALSGLNINKQALAVLSQNIANANTPDYSRKLVRQGNNIIDGLGYGVKLDDITRQVDEYLIRAQQQQQALLAKAEVTNSYADRTQQLLGKPGSGNSIDAGITDFFNTLQSLSDSPESSALRLGAVNAGVSVASRITQLATDLNELRLQADRDMKTAVDNVNSALKKLQGVNTSLNSSFYSGRTQADLFDQRDSLLRDIGQYVDLSYYFDETGAARVFSSTGVPLLDGSRYELTYTPQGSRESFVANAALNPVSVYRTDNVGALVGNPVDLISGGAPEDVTTTMVYGKMRALIDTRDQTIPHILEQLDTLAATLRDSFNAVHNQGTSFPGVTSLTGTRAVNAAEYYEWSGSARIALLDVNGRPVSSAYSDETSGFRPLTIDLGSLNTGAGAGKPSMQGIIDEINYHFTMPQNRVSLGDLNNIRLVSNQATLPGSPAQLTFDFDLENLTDGDRDFWVTGVTVLDDTNTDITSVTDTAPSADLAATGTYQTTNGSNAVTITTTAAHGLEEGAVIYLSTPSGAVNGIPAVNLGGFFTVHNVTSTTFQITAASNATATGSVNEASQTLRSTYQTATAGDLTRTRENGQFTASLTGNSTSDYYLVQVGMAVKNADGTVSQSTVQYRVLNNSANAYNRRYTAESATGSGEVHASTLDTPMLAATLVDENGNELPKANGKYLLAESGYLKLTTGSSAYRVAIDSLDSQQLGFPNNNPPTAGTNRGFSHFFELNNFFSSYQPTTTGDTVEGSAINLAVETRLRSNPNLISTGKLIQTARPADPLLPPFYTYETAPGDNRVLQDLAGLATSRQYFAASGGLGESTDTLNGYASQLIAFTAASANTANNEYTSVKATTDGLNDRLNAASGVNMDEELGNTVIYQNSYAASARLVTVVNQLFDTLLNAFQ